MVKEVLPRIEKLEAWVATGFKVQLLVCFICLLGSFSQHEKHSSHSRFLSHSQISLLVQDYKIRETDKALTVMEASGIIQIVFVLSRLAYYYDAGREVPVGLFGYHRLTKHEALKDWLSYAGAATAAEVRMPLCSEAVVLIHVL